jgi:hypothetical protein
MTEYFILWGGNNSTPPHPLLSDFLKILEPILKDADAAYAAGAATTLHVANTGVMIGFSSRTHPHITISPSAISAILAGNTPTVVQRKIQAQERK